jgi:hypothetical protein
MLCHACFHPGCTLHLLLASAYEMLLLTHASGRFDLLPVLYCFHPCLLFPPAYFSRLPTSAGNDHIWLHALILLPCIDASCIRPAINVS